MKTNAYIIFFLLIDTISMCQNLVPNGNFEIYSQCPAYGGQIKFVTGWDSASLSPDYLNKCATYTSGVNVPNTGSGYQQDCAGGGGYAGIHVLNKPFPDNGREYINYKLLDTLKQYHKYVAGMFVNLCDKCDYAIGTMGMYFSSAKIYSPNVNTGTYINIPNPQVKNTTVLNDTVNWVAIRDTFTAQGGEMFLTIGNFSSDAQSDTTFLYTNAFNGVSYYYIDSVTIFDTGLIGVNEFKKQDENFKISPNPNNGTFNIFVEGTAKQMKVEVTSLLGQSILEKEFDLQNANTVTIGNLVEGVYFIKLTLDGIHNKTQRIIVTK